MDIIGVPQGLVLASRRGRPDLWSLFVGIGSGRGLWC